MASESVTYDAAVIMDSADRLYKQAKSIVLSSTALGVLIGVVGGPVGFILATQSRSSLGIAAAVGAVIGGLMGYIRGTERAFSLKLQAQVALCQVQIERNTSAGSG
jgi:predicted signal transduction protein with EAL and GGDEF domain